MTNDVIIAIIGVVFLLTWVGGFWLLGQIEKLSDRVRYLEDKDRRRSRQEKMRRY